MPPVPAERCLAAYELSEPRLSHVDGRDVAVFGRSVDGVAHLVVRPLTAALDGFDSADEWTVATMPALRPARSLGGGSWCLTDGGDAAIYLAVDGDLWLQSLSFDHRRAGPPRRLTTSGAEHVLSGPVAAPDGRHVAYVVDMAEVWCLDLMTGATHRIDDGSDSFVIDPFVGEGTVGWVGWSEPHMPWDRARVREVSIRSDGAAAVDTIVAPIEGAVQQARRTNDGSLLAIRDDHGWLNVWLGDRPLVSEPFEHAGPTWGPGQRSYAASPDGASVAFTRNEDGFGRLCLVDVGSGTVTDVANGVHGQLDWHDGRLIALRTGGRTPTQVVVYDTTDWSRRTLAVGPDPAWLEPPLRDELVEPECCAIATSDGVVHARLYRADAERQPSGLLVWLHGGPTDQWMVTFLPRIAFWRSRGWHVLVPDHRGSTGHGREYQQALHGRWGHIDVDDTLAVTEWAHRSGLGSPAMTVLMGGSAGGFTALGALGRDPSRFAAAVVAYPVTDLEDLAERSHRFERHYTLSLVGPLPDTRDAHRERSPIWHAERWLHRPLLVLHGDVDPVVPVEHSRVFAARVAALGGDVTLHEYPGEGHGFRRREHQLDEFARVEDFVLRTVPTAARR